MQTMKTMGEKLNEEAVVRAFVTVQSQAVIVVEWR
jgi:hypothetical protein